MAKKQIVFDEATLRDIVAEGANHALSNFELLSYNGSDTPTKKNLPNAFADMSKNVRAITKDLADNTVQTKANNDSIIENTELLKSAKSRKVFIKNVKNLVQNADEGLHLSLFKKIIVGLVGIYIAYHSIKDVGLIEWIGKL